MKTILSSAIIFYLLLVGCTKTSVSEEQLIVNGVPAELNEKPAPMQDMTFSQPNLFPEGVVYDQFNKRFYVSSTSNGDIGIVGANGGYTPFITDPALTGTTGLEIDEARKLLYVANSTDGSVGVYNLNTGNRIAFYDLKTLLPGSPVFINHIALDPQGNAYITNSRTPVIYKISRDGTASIFYQDAAFATTGFGFNGIEYGNQNGGYLLVAYSVANQVIRFPINNPSAYNVVTLDEALAGPDGLLLSKSGKELVVVNNAGGGNGKVILFKTQNNWSTGTAANIFETGSVFPTTATTDGKNVFVLYAYLYKRATGQDVFTIKQVPGFGGF